MNIPAGQRVQISTLQIGETATQPAALVALNCQGNILLEDVFLNNSGGPSTFAHFENCSNVVLRGCDFLLGGYPLAFVDSNALLSTQLVHYHSPFPIGYATTTEGIRMVNSTVTTIGSVIRGAADFLAYGPYPPRPGIVVESGVLRVGPASAISGGTPGGFTPGVQVPNPAVAQVRLDPRGAIVNPWTISTVPETVDATYHSWVIANEAFGMTVAGPANGFALLALGDWLPNTPSPFGPLAMDPSTALPVELVPLSSGGGFYQWTVNCPQTAPVAHAFVLQALTIAPGGTLGITAPSPLTVGWPHGIIP